MQADVAAPRALRTALAANYFAQGWGALVNIAFIPAYIAYLGVPAYGLIGAFTVILNCAILLDAGLTPTLNREMARSRAGERSPEDTADLLRSVELFCAGIGVTLVAAAPLLAVLLHRAWLNGPEFEPHVLVQALCLMIVTAVARTFEGVFRGALLGLHRPVLANSAVSFFTTLRAGGVVAALAFISPTITTFFWWQCAVSILSLSVLVLLVHREMPTARRRPKFSAEAIRGIRRFASGVIGTSVLALLLTQTDKVLLLKLLPLQSFAYYALATAVTAGLYQLVIPVSQSFYPVLTHLFSIDAKADLAARYHLGAQIGAGAAAPVAAMLIFFARPILMAWTGDAVLAEHAGLVLPLLTAGTFLHCMMYMPYMLQLSSGWPQLALFGNALAVAILVPALRIVVPEYGTTGAASVWLILNVFYAVVIIHFMHRRLLPASKWRWYVRDIGRPVLAASAVCAMLRLVLPLSSGHRLVTILMLAIASALALLASIIAVIVSNGYLPRLIARAGVGANLISEKESH